MTKEQARIIINANRSTIYEGNTFTEGKLCRMTGLDPLWLSGSTQTMMKQANKYGRAKLTAYASLNKALREEGLVIRQINTGTHYRVTTLTEAPRVAATYAARASRITRNKATITAGAQARGIVFTGATEE